MAEPVRAVAARPPAAPGSPVAPGSPAAGLGRPLAELTAVVAGLSAAQYTARPAGFPCCVGQQVRHCLDHVAAVFDGLRDGRIDYERRLRGATLEQDRDLALATLRELATHLAALEDFDRGMPVRVFERVAADHPPSEHGSTLGREIAFVTSHMTHHNALVAWMVRALGHEVPERFGYGASTLAFLDRLACAR